MTESPYPSSKTTTSEVVVAYSLREIIDQINSKLDLLPTIVVEQASQKDATAKLEARLLVTETKIETFEHERDQASGATLFRDKVWAKFVGLASVMGVVAGITVEIINKF